MFLGITDCGDGGWKVIIVAVVLISLQILMVTGRFSSRMLKKVGLKVDDYVLLFATAFTIVLCALALVFPRIAGGGSHAETFPEGRLVGQTFMAWMIIYGASIALSKCAILLLYIRVFTTSKKSFTITAYAVGFIIIATAIANTFISILQCSPQALAWDKSIQGGVCIDEIAWIRYMAIPNVLTGAIMLIMPIPLVWRLNVPLEAKIALTATFLHGIIGFIASCARLTNLFATMTSHFSNTTSITRTIWTINEPANYIIAASLPTLRPILTHLLPPAFFILSNPANNPSPSPLPKSSQTPSPNPLKTTYHTSHKSNPSLLKISWPRAQPGSGELHDNAALWRERRWEDDGGESGGGWDGRVERRWETQYGEGRNVWEKSQAKRREALSREAAVWTGDGGESGWTEIELTWGRGRKGRKGRGRGRSQERSFFE